jgi:hypothetical protein
MKPGVKPLILEASVTEMSFEVTSCNGAILAFLEESVFLLLGMYYKPEQSFGTRSKEIE